MAIKKFITIEGIDGVGKSTVSKAIADVIGAKFIQTPYFKKHAEKDCEDKFSYYLNDLIYLKHVLVRELQENSVVCDRYIHSTLAYQGEDVDATKIMEKYDLLKPDLTIYLTVDEDIRLSRLKEREIINNFVNEMDHDYIYLKSVSNNFNKMKDMITLDTTNRSIDEIVKNIREII